ncbi:c-type cytochrome [Candidatus Albibeggiatoa sp. nov. NOAA]|uniref:c-type cytochrome n=1 Tax=Candidatus Albibeggiatoa sp. nov. NOAA TaxID=3162724 RepID=UPI0033030D4D|nr:cytochrome c4 [Thiotrichaceae bacterium]
MRNKTLKYALLLVSGFALSSPVWAENECPDYDKARGAMLANTCAGCHGTNGASVGPASPIIGGLSAETISETMKAYKSGDRPSTIMGRIARGYTDEEIDAMAGFFCEQKFVPAKQEVDAEKAEAGKELHDKYKCEKCHEEGGTIDVDGSSIIAGQWKAYLAYELSDFQEKHRGMPKKMKRAMKKLLKQDADARLEQIIEYYASQQ